MPEIIAHRGASRERLENTLAAFQRALDLGADAVELDVHCTADGAVVVHHDPVVRGTGDDPGLAGTPIARLTTAQLATFRLTNGDRVPTLAQVATLLGTQATLYCELKGAGTAAPACAVLGAHSVSSAVHSFDHRMVAAAASVAPRLCRGVLEVSRHIDVTASLRSVEARDLWQLVDYLDEDTIRAVHAIGGRAIAWTANDAPLIERLTHWNVDALCTDDVALARSVLGR